MLGGHRGKNQRGWPHSVENIAPLIGAGSPLILYNIHETERKGEREGERGGKGGGERGREAGKRKSRGPDGKLLQNPEESRVWDQYIAVAAGKEGRI